MNELNFLTPEARQRLLDRGFDFMRRAVSLGTNGEFVSCTGKPLTDAFVLTHSVPVEIQAVLANALQLLFERVDLVPETVSPETAETAGHPMDNELTSRARSTGLGVSALPTGFNG